MNAKAWFYQQSFNGADRDAKVLTVGEYTNVPAEHHLHLCVRCQKDYPCTARHYRHDGETLVPTTPPRATKFCGECRFLGV